MKKTITILTGLVLSTSLAIAAPDLEAGKAKAEGTCVACHGANGISILPIYPNLAGQKADYLVKQLKAFKAGTRVDPVMQPMVAPLSEEDEINVSAYYSSLPAGGK